MTVNDPMFMKLTLARLQASAAVLIHSTCCLLTFWDRDRVSTHFPRVKHSKKTTRNRWKRGHVGGGVDSGWSSGTENEPISLEREEKQRKNGDTGVTPEKSE
jgi:hypothetical protein